MIAHQRNCRQELPLRVEDRYGNGPNAVEKLTVNPRKAIFANGLTDRVDLFGVLWLQRRALRPLLLGETPAEVPTAARRVLPEPAVSQPG